MNLPVVDCSMAMRQLYDYLDGELSEEKAEAIRAHIELCVPCFKHASFEKELLDIVANGWNQVTASADLQRRILEHLRAEGFTGQ